MATAAAYTVGCSVRLKGSWGEEVLAGEVFAFDEATGCLVLSQPGDAPATRTLRVVRADAVREVEEAAPPDPGRQEVLPAVCMERAAAREERAVKAAELEAARIGVGVTPEGQRVFDALAKTLPCRWDGKTIVILEDIFISEPYGPADCKCTHDSAGALVHVRKILGWEEE